MLERWVWDPRYQYVCSTSFTGITGEEIAFLLVAKRAGHKPKTVEDNLTTAGVSSPWKSWVNQNWGWRHSLNETVWQCRSSHDFAQDFWVMWTKIVFFLLCLFAMHFSHLSQVLFDEEKDNKSQRHSKCIPRIPEWIKWLHYSFQKIDSGEVSAISFFLSPQQTLLINRYSELGVLEGATSCTPRRWGGV